MAGGPNIVDSPGGFPPTRHSLLSAARQGDDRARDLALDALIAGYWKPVYKYLRVRWRLDAEDARDATQGFFATFLEKEHLRRYDPARGRFRTYLRVCVDGHASNERKAQRALKRGGGAVPLSLDFEGADGELVAQQIPDSTGMEEFFRREWVRHLFGTAVEALRARCEATGRARAFTLFERCDLDPPRGAGRPTYAQLGEELGMTVSQVTNQLHAVRAAFRSIVLERLRDLTATDEEYRQEAREVLGTDPP